MDRIDIIFRIWSRRKAVWEMKKRAVWEQRFEKFVDRAAVVGAKATRKELWAGYEKLILWHLATVFAIGVLEDSAIKFVEDGMEYGKVIELMEMTIPIATRSGNALYDTMLMVDAVSKPDRVIGRAVGDARPVGEMDGEPVYEVDVKLGGGVKGHRSGGLKRNRQD